MLFTQLAAQMKSPGQALRLRVWAILAVVITAAVWMIYRPAGPRETMSLICITQLSLAVLVGGSLTGWRVTQMPKTRASEFYLLTPVSDWEIVGGEVLSGMIRSGVVVGAISPLVAVMWGLGWVDVGQVAAMVALPVAAGWAVGIGIAVVAYEPLWLRSLWEKFVLLLILVYLFAFGLAAHYAIPVLNNVCFKLTGMDLVLLFEFLRPQRMLNSWGAEDTREIATTVAWMVGIILVGVLLGIWRLVARLRDHYIDEIFGQHRPKKDYGKPIAENPLSWWTARRVSRFRGAVNLYLAWTVILLYSAWMLYRNQWPTWMGMQLMLVFHRVLGGAAIMGVTCIQFGLVPAAFLSGLWDSTPQQRIGRLELLLASPLEARHFLGGSIAAVWTRAKGYLAAALVVWMAAAGAGVITWPMCVGVILLAANYVLLFFAVAFWNFPRVAGDRSAASWGIGMAVGVPAFTMVLFALGLGRAAAVTPLGGMYLLVRPAAEQLAQTGMTTGQLWQLVGAANLVYLLASIALLRYSLSTFDREIRAWFGRNLSATKPKKKKDHAQAATTAQPAASPEAVVAE